MSAAWVLSSAVRPAPLANLTCALRRSQPCRTRSLRTLREIRTGRQGRGWQRRPQRRGLLQLAADPEARRQSCRMRSRSRSRAQGPISRGLGVCRNCMRRARCAGAQGDRSTAGWGWGWGLRMEWGLGMGMGMGIEDGVGIGDGDGAGRGGVRSGSGGGGAVRARWADQALTPCVKSCGAAAGML